MSRPEVPKRCRASRLLYLGDAVAPEDVEPTLLVFQLFENRVQAVLQRSKHDSVYVDMWDDYLELA
jgi:hypothetical protein